MKTPKVSVIMPIFNGARYLREAIDSILNQTCADFEFIICNEFGSDDGSADIINEYAEKDSRIILLQNKTRLGISASLNRMLDIAKGEYVARMDADDISGRRRFETQLIYMAANPHIGCFGTTFQPIDENGNIIRSWNIQYHSDPEICKASTIFRQPMRHPVMMWRNDLAKSEGIRYIEDIAGNEDTPLIYAMTKRFPISVIMDKTLFKYRIWHGGTEIMQRERDIPLAIQNARNIWFDSLGFTFDDSDIRLLSIEFGIREYDNSEAVFAYSRMEELLEKIVNRNYKLSTFAKYALDFMVRYRWRKEMEFLNVKYGWRDNIPGKLIEIYEASPYYRVNNLTYTT